MLFFFVCAANILMRTMHGIMIAAADINKPEQVFRETENNEQRSDYYLHVINDSEAAVNGYGRNCRRKAALKKADGFHVITCDSITAKTLQEDR